MGGKGEREGRGMALGTVRGGRVVCVCAAVVGVRDEIDAADESEKWKCWT